MQAGHAETSDGVSVDFKFEQDPGGQWSVTFTLGGFASLNHAEAYAQFVTDILSGNYKSQN